MTAGRLVEPLIRVVEPVETALFRVVEPVETALFRVVEPVETLAPTPLWQTKDI